MKKVLISAVLLSFFSNGKACADYYPDGDYFNLFAQTIIKDKTYVPFLLNYGSQFYNDGIKRMIPDENIYAWQKFFGNRIDYRETEYLVNHMSMADLNAYKRGSTSNQILAKIGTYSQNSEAIDYLIEAKYLEPYMKIQYMESPDSFYYRNENDNTKNATDLNYEKTVSALTSLYHAARNPEIKQRYGYQLVRFNHYTRNFEKAIEAFKNFVEPIKLRSVPYYYALDQMAGAQRGLKMNNEANWNFFQVFANAPSKKESAFVSMKLSDSASFQNILKRTTSSEQKNLAYFLLGYSDFTNPIPNMEKMYEIDPNSEILKVMAARSINQLEREYLPIFIAPLDGSAHSDGQVNGSIKKAKKEETATEKKESFWDKVLSFFKNLFGGNKEQSDSTKRTTSADDDELLENPNRIPIYGKKTLRAESAESTDYLDQFSDLTEKTKSKSSDEFWHIADAYLKFLQKDYDQSEKILAGIKTSNPEYQEQITRMKMLNDIVSQPKIDSAFENHITQQYPNVFVEEKPKQDSVSDYYYGELPTTADFVRDVLANRYFLQGEDGKSFLLNNELSDLQYYPNVEIAQKVQQFVNKPNKTALEQNIIMKNVNIEDSDAFFNVIYGDQEMRMANFEKAKNFYSKAQNFSGIPRYNYDWSNDQPTKTLQSFPAGTYNGFANISSLIFAHNKWESFQSPEEQSMVAESFVSEFPYIKDNMTKLELASALVKLKTANTANANQLIGNVLYNTSSLGYFRELFIMDINNGGWSKNDVLRNSYKPVFKNYYKQYSWIPASDPDNFDVPIKFYEKALKMTADPEQKTRILFQLASAEQGKYYQWRSEQNDALSYVDPKWSEKRQAFENNLLAEKHKNYKKYFALMKKDFADTETSRQLMGSCSYYGYFMRR